MNEQQNSANTTIGDHNIIGVNASAVHDSQIYINSPQDSPEEVFKAARNRLRAGFPDPALFREAIGRGHDFAEVRFHLVLALLSGRSFRDLTVHERNELKTASELAHLYENTSWKNSLIAVCSLLESINAPDKSANAAIEAIHEAPRSHYAMIVKHLDLVMTGSKHESFWTERLRSANSERLANGRTDRVWAYFEPEPIGPRAKPPVDPVITVADRLWTYLGSLAAALALSRLVYLPITDADTSALLSTPIMLIAGALVAFGGARWRHRNRRLEFLSNLYFGDPAGSAAPDGGFTDQVDKQLNRYFSKYRPSDLDSASWLRRTAGLRAVLRDEIADIYREERVRIERLIWLIRFLAIDARDQWARNELFDFQRRYQTPVKTMTWCAIASAAVMLSGWNVVESAFRVRPVEAVLLVLTIALAVRFTVPRWFRMYSERRRYDEESREHLLSSEKRENEYERWNAKLEATRPTEVEMETWLDADRTILLDGALRHYALTWHDVIAHAFMQTPSSGASRGRAKGTLWRYSAYELRLFLITRDGVREVSTELDFKQATFSGEDRRNYRFDAVSTVQVTTTRSEQYTLRLTLNNGDPRNMLVTAEETEHPDADENLHSFTKKNLHFAGFMPTLHILEGIAAEGKNWINYDPHRQSAMSGA